MQNEFIPTFHPATPGFHVSLTSFLEAASNAGYPAIEYPIDPFTRIADEQGTDAVREMLEAHKLELGSFFLPVEFREDEDTFREQLQALPRHAALARELGVTRCCTWLFPTTEQPVAEFTARLVRRLRRCAQVLETYGIRFGLEWVGPKTARAENNTFIHTLPGLLELIAAIDEKNVGVLFDSFHWYTSQATVDDILALSAEQIVHVHMNDAPDRPVDEQIDQERLLPGEGIIDLSGMLGALRQIGYSGYVAVETFSSELAQLDAEEVARRSKAQMDQVLSNGKER